MLQAQSTTIRDAFELFQLDNRARRFTPLTVTFYKTKLIPFIEHCEATSSGYVDGLTPRAIRAFLVGLQERGLADHTVHGAARAIRTFCNFLVRENILTASPMRNVPMPKVDKRILPSLSVEDARNVLEACETERDKAAVLFLLDTGLRAAEFVALNGGDIDLGAGTVRVKMGKGRKDRTGYLGNRTTKQLLRYYMDAGKPAQNEPVWRNERTGARLSTSGLRQMLRKAGKRAAVPHVRPHTLRRTFALWSLRSGMSIYHLQRIMGHADIATLRSYLALVDADIAQAHRDFGAVDTML